MAIHDDRKIDNIKQAISQLESQREILGDETVRESLKPLRKKLASLEGSILEIEHQRKLATILFMDVVGSTRLGQLLEPDEVLELMDGALKRLAAPIEEHGGHVTRFQGDGFKAVFGVPVAHENDPEQAVRAGLRILELAQDIAREWEQQHAIPGFQVRIGVNTGLVASGGETEADDTVMGRAVNLAARLESAAPPGGLLISHFTYRHVRGVFDVDVLPPIRAKGFDKPVEVYLVKRAKPRSFRVLNRGVEGVETRMVGREAELKYLQDALLTAVKDGEGQVVTVVGEAGVGKSRLIYEFQNWLTLLPQRVLLFLGQATQESQHIPFSLLRDLFILSYRIKDTDPVEIVRDKFEQGITESIFDSPAGFDQSDLSNQAQVHLLGQLLGFDFSYSPHLKGFLQDAEALRNRGLLALEDYFKTLCTQKAVVILLEDLHWADQSSLDAIRWLGKITPNMPLLIVCLTRGDLYELCPYWGEGEQFHTRLDLHLLSKRESHQLVGEILQFVDQLPLELRELVANSSEGNPFYLEELIKVLIEQDVILTGEVDHQGIARWRVVGDRLTQIELPTTLTGVLEARLDCLTIAEKKMLQQAAVAGRTFWISLVEHISFEDDCNLDGEQLAEVVKVLREKELIFQHEESAITGGVEYSFKHDLLREVVYETVLIRDRRRYHELVADWLLANCGERLGEYYGVIGEHLALARKTAKATSYFLQAGDRALVNYANIESQRYYERSLVLEPEDKLRWKLLSGLGRAYNRQGMYERAIENWEVGIEICRRREDVEGLAYLVTLTMRAAIPYHPEHAMQFCQVALRLVEQMHEGPLLAHMLHQVGRSYHFNGISEDARRYCQYALEMGERLGDVAVQADTLTTMALLVDITQEDALQALTRAEKLAESQQLMYILGRSRHNLSEVTFHSFGDLETSHSLALKAAEVVRMRGDVEWELAALSNAASIRLEMGNFEGAKVLLDHIENRLTSYPILDWIQQVTLSWRGLYQTFRGDWSSALESIYQVIKYGCTEKTIRPNKYELYTPQKGHFVL
jgi:predicted ATPase/class 3 adenylate cyclase